MFKAYHRYRALHELMALLDVAIARALPGDAERLQECLHFVRSLCDSRAALDEAVRVSDVRDEVLRQVRLAMRLLPP
jgi:hypothetical protein